MTDIITVSGAAHHIYSIEVPSAESIMLIVLGISLWYVCIRGFAIGNFDEYITKQIEAFDTNLTIVTFCIILIAPVFLFIQPIAMYNLITAMVSQGSYMPSIWDSWQFALIPQLYNILIYVFVALGIWCAINVVHMIGLAIDDVTVWLKERRAVD